MNKDFWERIDILEELAGKIPQGDWAYEPWNENIRCDGKRVGVVLPECGKYIAAANPAMIKEMIAKMRRLEKEANWLAEKLAEASGSMFDDEMKDLGFMCLHECEQVGCSLECRKINWKESARKAVENK